MIPRNLLPDDLYTFAFVAGGFAVCPALADDIDVWVGGQSDPADTRDRILEHLRDSAYRVQEETHRHDEFDNYGNVWATLKVAKVGTGKRVFHILVSEGGPVDVINTFDLSTSRVAITTSGHVFKGDDWTPITEPPLVLRDTPTTQARLNKYTSRFEPNIAEWRAHMERDTPVVSEVD